MPTYYMQLTKEQKKKMGMSASQARLLMLTARKSDIEYQMQQISQQKLAMARQTEAISEKYNAAINNMKTQVKTASNGYQDLTYSSLMNAPAAKGGRPRFIIAARGNGNKTVFVGTPEIKEKYQDTVNNPLFFTDFNGIASESTHYYAQIDGKAYTAGSFETDDDGNVVIKAEGEGDSAKKYVNVDTDGDGTYETRSELLNAQANGSDNWAFLEEGMVDGVDPNKIYYATAGEFERMIANGEIMILEYNEETNSYEPINTGSNVGFKETADTSDDAIAEAEYKYETQKIQTKEKKLDLTLKQLETQHTAITTELESVGKILKDNIESTFKTFG